MKKNYYLFSVLKLFSFFHPPYLALWKALAFHIIFLNFTLTFTVYLLQQKHKCTLNYQHLLLSNTFKILSILYVCLCKCLLKKKMCISICCMYTQQVCAVPIEDRRGSLIPGIGKTDYVNCARGSRNQT